MNSIRHFATVSTLLIGAGLSAASFAADDKPAAAAKPATTVVLVHGAFADGSSWNRITPLLQAKGLNVVAVQNPLTSLADDVAFANRAIDAQTGPVVLVGHSWGGTVITQAGVNERVKALVYVAAFAPSPGEASLDGVKRFPPAPGLAHPIADAHGYLKLSASDIATYFAQDLPAKETNLIATSQGAVRGKNFEEPVSAAAWQGKPSWYIVADNDYMIQPAAQRAYATKLKATTVSLSASHVPMLSKPQDVADAIIAAADSIGK